MGGPAWGADRPSRFGLVKHTPHLVVGGPWSDSEVLPLTITQWRHLTKALRLGDGDDVTYTDGLGTIGRGSLGHQQLVRGEETLVPPMKPLTVAVAPPNNKDRQRFLVEKLAELGVIRLRWLRTSYGANRPAAPPKVFSWVLAAVEQSRGAWLMEVDTEMVGWADLEGPLVVCDQTGSATVGIAHTVVIGPEGGWAPEEVPADVEVWNLGPNVLRTETAAIVAAARLLFT